MTTQDFGEVPNLKEPFAIGVLAGDVSDKWSGVDVGGPVRIGSGGLGFSVADSKS